MTVPDTSGPSRIIEAAFRQFAELRRARVFHPRGITLAGTVRGEGEFTTLLGAGERPVFARMSKGIGMPRQWPDVLGLALHVQDRQGQAWDFALASTGSTRLSRLVPVVPRGWARATYGSLLLYSFGGQEITVWLFVLPTAGQPQNFSLDSLAEYARGHAVGFALSAHRIKGDTLPFAKLTLTAIGSTQQLDAPSYYDPMRHHPAHVGLRPAFISQIWECAYRGSLRGRTSSSLGSC